VTLVELPSSKLKPGTPGKAMKTTKTTKSQKTILIKRKTKKIISLPRTKKRTITIAKKTVSKKKKNSSKSSASRLIEQAISKIKTRVKEIEAEERIERKIKKITSKIESSGGEGRPSSGYGYGQAVPGLAIQLYQVEVEERIKANWSYPTALQSGEDLEAILILLVNRSGKILNIEFKKRSGNRIFDKSVLKAVKRSDPLPPFPEGYIKASDEIEVRFNLKDLQARR
jgi:colicin import membrane protein